MFNEVASLSKKMVSFPEVHDILQMFCECTGLLKSKEPFRIEILKKSK
jgi:hypothetical protein